MRVKFADIDGGDILYEKEEKNIQNLLPILNENAQINIHRSEDDYCLGKYSSHILNIDISDEDNPKEELFIYLDIR